MNKEPSTISIEYDKHRGIFLKFYDESFFNWSKDITQEIMEVAVEKLFDDMDCPTDGGIVQLERTKGQREGVVKVLAEVLPSKK